VYATTTTGLIRAPRHQVYAALLDPDAVARWRVPDAMTAEVHEWDPRVGGRFRVSLTYDGDEAGKTGGHTDTYVATSPGSSMRACRTRSGPRTTRPAAGWRWPSWRRTWRGLLD
jgi:hypothetical protein